MKFIFSFILFLFYSSFCSMVNADNQIKLISAQEANIMVKADKAVIFDVREGSENDEERIPNAISVSQNKLVSESEFYLNQFKDKIIILHCRTGVRSGESTQKLQKMRDNIYSLQGGIVEWKKQGLPVIKSHISIMRQVQIAVGIITVSFALLGVFINRKFIIVNILVGLGLFSAGVTGFCGLALLIKMMPWNK